MAKSVPAPVIPLFYPPSDVFEQVLQFEILGQPARKSNSRRIVTNMKTGKPMIIKSDAAQDYVKSFLKQVPSEAKLGLGSKEDPLFMVAELYYKSMRPDISVELIKDLLQESGVIKNDRFIRGELLLGRISQNNPRAIVTLFRLKG